MRPLPILCLEDDQHVGQMIRRALGAREVDLVDRVATSRAMLIEGREYSAWLLDVSVPDGSGLELLEWARARGDRTPALVMTGLDDRAVANRAQELGAEFVFKPYTKASLDAFVKRSDLQRQQHGTMMLAAERLALRYKLPWREHEIVRALARGVSRAGLAKDLGIKENTVKTTVRKLLGRTQHANLDELLRSLLRLDH